MAKKDSENNFCRNLREALGIEMQKEMAQRLGISLACWNMAENRSGGRVSGALLKRIVHKFGWSKVAPVLKKELEAD